MEKQDDCSLIKKIGLVGTRHVDEHFLWGVDAAFVIDRRGTGDIVTCNGARDFCSDAFGTFVEETANECNLSGWTCTRGGSSDTAVWAENGIQSVNLSAGYGYEHTDREYVDMDACYRVTKLLKGVFERGREMKAVLHQMEREERLGGRNRFLVGANG